MLDESVIAYALTIQGWMSLRELRWLAEQASQARTIIEIGCWKGRSTVVLAAHTPGRVWAIDHWQGQRQDPTAGPSVEVAARGGAAIREEFEAHLAPYRSKVTVLPLPSEEAIVHLSRDRIQAEFIFIDGAHDEAAVTSDIVGYRALLAPTGLLAGHDYRSPEPRHAGVTRAVDRLIGPVETCDYIWWRL
jgi:hypothetical protein